MKDVWMTNLYSTLRLNAVSGGKGSGAIQIDGRRGHRSDGRGVY